MNITYLIQVLQNKMTVLNNAKIQAFSMGDIDQITAIEKELFDTQDTFAQLNLLLKVTQDAASANTTPAEVIATALGSIQSPTPTVQGPSAGAIVGGYDISAYATDPAHEQKIQSLVNAIPALTTATDIDTYIHNLFPDSPVTGDMVMNSSVEYNVDIPLLLAIMQNDSAFGTAGIGARTNNPGNVGNNGIEERTYDSWELGVSAVAEWLSKHKII